MKVPNRLLKLINEKNDFLIATHIKPEGDAIGSSLALALGLKKIGKRVYLINRDPVPSMLRFLPSSRLFKRRPPRKMFDLLFLLDCNTLERTGFKTGVRAENTAIVDHHILNDDAVQSISKSLTYINPEAAATGVLVYKILQALKIPLDKRIATNLYTSILDDTGGFRYSNTDPESLKIASYLVEAGAKPYEITKELYENVTLSSIRLRTLALSTIKMKDGVAWIIVTEDMLRRTRTTAEDTEDFVNFPRGVKGVEVAVFFREEDSGFCKVSLRSKGSINVAKLADGLGGGGHAAAAGCKVRGSLKEVQEKVLKIVRRAIKRR